MTRASLLLACFLLVTGCAAPPYVAGKRVAPASPADVAHDEGRVEGKGGLSLFRQSWKPEQGEAKGTVVIVHGLKDYSDRYLDLAVALARKGYAVHAFDLRGHGDSEGDRVWVEQFEDYLDDLDRVVKLARAEAPGKPFFLFGHSMGGAIVTLYTMTKQPALSGLVVSAGALKTEESSIVTGGARAAAVLSPRLAVFSLDDEKFSRDPKVVASMKSDPLIYDQNAPARTAREVLDAIVHLRAGRDRLDVPLLALHGSKDQITPPAGSKELVDEAASKDKTLKLYDGLFHDLLHEPEAKQVLDDIVTWVEGHTR